MRIKTAIIPVAGAGTRVFPMTTAIEKCMMPVYASCSSRPVVDYMVEDCVLAGIERIIFVTSARGKQQLKDYFETIPAGLEAQIRGLDKQKIIDKENDRRQAYNVKFEYVVQPADKYGTAYPPYLSRELLDGEDAFALMGGDDFVYRQDGGSELADAIALWEDGEADHVIMGNPVPHEQGSRFGILHVDPKGHMIKIDEKPPMSRVPAAPVANISRYILSAKIWPQLEAEMAKERFGSDEHFITYAINDALDAGQSFLVHEVKGKYLEGGSFDGLQAAGVWISQHPKKIPQGSSVVI